MSPRGSSSTNPSSSHVRNASAPYTRRPVGQPKSSRQQFSACGACRMRRVRCDLKDLVIGATDPRPACSNCKERGLKCVDEFADIKAVKQLRRGRRLQQVEAMYGKVNDPDHDASCAAGPSSSHKAPTAKIIPKLQPEFFSSPFWRWFLMQRPILDPTEFPARFAAHSNGTHPLAHEGTLLGMLLVVWAISFGVNEYGVPENDDTDLAADAMATSRPTSSGRGAKRGGIHVTAADRKTREATAERIQKERKEKVEAMIQEVLGLIDLHGVLRRPTWDGVRVLLLILPLMDDAHPLERLAMYEAAVSQAQALSTLATSSGPSSILPAADDSVFRARIFWYAYIYEGISTGLRGGRLILDNDDFDVFQNTLPPTNFSSLGNIGLPSPTSPTGPSLPVPSTHQTLYLQRPMSSRGSPAQPGLDVTSLFAVPLHISAICRKIHAVLTGPKAARRVEDRCAIDAEAMSDIWDDLDACWEQFEALKRSEAGDDSGFMMQFASAWLIFIFECHNIIRESLKQFMSTAGPSNQTMYSSSPPPRPQSHSSASSPYLSPQYLHGVATRKCLNLLPRVLHIIRRHLSPDRISAIDSAVPHMFKWDAGFVRDGCFFAGFLAATIEGDTIDFPQEREPKQEDVDAQQGHPLSTEEGVAVCLAALSAMRWVGSKSEEREETIRMVWENKKIRRHAPDTHSDDHTLTGSRLTRQFNSRTAHSSSGLPPLSLGLGYSTRRSDSLPNTACTTDGTGASGWPSYSPPGTGNSATTSGTGMSARGSPVFPAGTFKHGGSSGEEDPAAFYHVGDLDQFNFNVPGAIGGGASSGGESSGGSAYHHRSPPGSSHTMHSTMPAGSYLDPGAFGHHGGAGVDASGLGSVGSHLSLPLSLAHHPHQLHHHHPHAAAGAADTGIHHFGDGSANGFYH